MAESSIRVLVVEDYEPFRRFIHAELKNRPQPQLIGEASDGLEAVEKARALQPDLILLDIGLPRLTGIEAARQIRKCSPQSKILFLSENRSWDIAEEALRAGAGGYVVKSDAAKELWPAVEAVLQGNRFVSSSLAGHELPDTSAGDSSNISRPEQVVAPLPPRNVRTRHEVAFYRNDVAFVDDFARLIEAVLKAGNAVLLIVSESHRAGIFQRLRAGGLDVGAAIVEKRLIPVDAFETVSAIMVNDLPVPARCASLVADLINDAIKGIEGEHPRLAICGECAPRLLAQGNVEAAILLEHLWEEVTRNYQADTLCGYLCDAFPHEESDRIFQRICAEHSAVHGRPLGY